MGDRFELARQPAAYSDRAIVRGIAEHDIVIHPYVQKNLGTSSYDVTLGEWFYREVDPGESTTAWQYPLFNIYDEVHVVRVWGEPMRAREAKVEFPTYTKIKGIKPDDKVILVAPGETILAHTEEFIGGRDHITTMMKARSSFGRNFIEICKCAGWGDVGYINRWTMEVTNNSRYYTIPLVIGMRIAQLIFFETGEIIDKKLDYSFAGKYQNEVDLERLRETWHPSQMLPKLYNDRELRGNEEMWWERLAGGHISGNI